MLLCLKPTFVGFPWRRQGPEAHFDVELPGALFDILHAALFDGESPLSIPRVQLISHILPSRSHCSCHNTVLWLSLPLARPSLCAQDETNAGHAVLPTLETCKH